MSLLGWKKSRAGFTLIELAIVLSIVGTVTAGLWRISSNSNQQTKDQITAQQQVALITAIKAFLNDNSGANSGQTWLSGFAVNTNHTLALPGNCTAPTGIYTVMCTYLPPGLTSTTTNPYAQTYAIQVKTGATVSTQNYSFMIATIGGNTIPDADGGRISGLMGSDGGFLYTSNVCGTPTATSACGAMNSWTALTTSYGFGSGPAPGPATTSGSVVSLSSPNSSTTINPQWLARPILPSDPTPYYSNTMATDIFMGPYVAANDAALVDPANPGIIMHTGAIHLQNGFIDGSGTTTPTGPQIALITSTPPTNPPDIIGNSLVQLTTGCSLTNPVYEPAPNPTATPPIPPQGKPVCNNGLTVFGDIGLSGEIEALKIYSSSDARLKTDIRPIKNALNDLMKIDPVSFTFKAGGSKSMGVIAQNVEKVYPVLVSLGNNGKYVEYNGLIGPLIAAVQELKHQNDAMREQLQEQKEKLDMLEKKQSEP